ncbi:3'-tRNA processing endoribonuclease [Aureococcus anophagefferens]|nr:3'-tRNA processing endoribonuclease [Aureococcus anophagefferens]
MASSSAGRLLLCLAATAALLRTPAPRRAHRRVSPARAAARMPPPEEPGAPEEESGLDYAASVALGAAKRREREAALGASDMEVTFLGTASCVPFGLPGSMCLIGQNRVKGDAPVEQSETQLERNFLADPDKNFGEQRGGRDIRPDADGAWTLAPRGALAVRAAPMRHTVPCVGYVCVEPDKVGTLDVAKVEPILARNAEALKQAGVKEPKRIFRLLKDMARDQTFTFPDGTALKRSECVGEDKPGRVVVICGDTADASALLPLLPPRGADVVVHEATNARLEPWDADKTDAEVAEATAAHGHSTPTMAAKFASLAAAKCLALTHFSPRYRGDSALSSISTMDKIEASARQGFDEDVIAAWDLLTLPVNAKTVEEAARREGRLAVAAVRKARQGHGGVEGPSAAGAGKRPREEDGDGGAVVV